MDRKIIAASALALLTAGCMPDSPRTALDWGVNTRTPHRVAAAKTYVYEEPDVRPSARPAPSPVSRNATAYAPVTKEPLAPVSSDAPSFSWPVSGRVISDFGTTATGGRNDGINIATQTG